MKTSVAKDFEAVRFALNETFNYVGLSYGSYLGAQYAELFPDNIRTMALDGIVQHSQSEAANMLIESTSYELSLSHFFSWANTNESSALKGQDVENLWLSLLANASFSAIPAPACNGTTCRTSVTAEDIAFNAQGFLAFYGDSYLGPSWATLSQALYNASQGDASGLSTSYADDVAAEYAIQCLDFTHTVSSTFWGVTAQENMVYEYAPLTRGASQTWGAQLGCLGWPLAVTNPPKKLDIKTNAKILMTQSTADPETGLPWALGMLEEIENKVLVLREGDGHTSFLLFGDTTEVIFKYLVSGEAPQDGVTTTS